MTVYLQRHAQWLAVVLATLFFLQGFFGNQQKSLTWDEPSYISGGYTYLKWGDFRLNPSHPPLMQDLAALPLLFMDLNAPPQNDPSWTENINPVVEFGRQFFFERGNDVGRITFWARMPVLLLGTFLVLAIYLWGASLYGKGPALLAAAVAAFSPNLLAHSKVATEDLGCTVFMFLAVWSLWSALRKGRRRDWLVCGLLTGLALVAKYTALVLGPIYAVLVAGFWWMHRREQRESRQLLLGLTVVGGVSIFVIGASYNFSFDYSIYLQGIQKIYTDYPTDVQYYLYGRFFDTPVWYYHIAAFLIKVPVPVLALLVFAGFAAYRNRRFDEASFFLLVPVIFVVAVSCVDKHNIGFRRILPVFPFLFLFLAGACAGKPGRSGAVGIAVLLVWLVFEAWSIYPHHLSYFNTFAGGPRRGPYLLDDSNIDWGQDLPALAAWQQQHGKGRPLKLFYFGIAEPGAYGLQNLLQMDQREIMYPQPGFYAISAHYLVFIRSIQVNDGYDVDWLTKYKPVGYAGNSIYIYQFQ